jgi:hypothetical protein
LRVGRLQEIKNAEADIEKVESQALTNAKCNSSRLIGASVLYRSWRKPLLLHPLFGVLKRIMKMIS